MSIDAVIERIRHTEAGLRLELAPRVEPSGQDSIAGQPALTIYGGRSFSPAVGMEVWGADICEVIDRDPLSGLVRRTQQYDRRGSTRLREKRRCICGEWMTWTEIHNEKTGETREVFLCHTCRKEAPLDAAASPGERE